jgi:regulator of telomere elongation helicase 1
MFVQKNNNRDHKNGTKRNNNDENNDNKRASSKAKVKASSSPPQTVSICGIDVHFPFTPYPNQKTYMETVMNALHNSENALLESPTGTGKTLCLLCSTLAWQMEQRSKLNDTNDDDDNVTQQQQQQQQHSTSTNIVSGQRRRVPTIIYASRTHSQLSQVVKELR